MRVQRTPTDGYCSKSKFSGCLPDFSLQLLLKYIYFEMPFNTYIHLVFCPRNFWTVKRCFICIIICVINNNKRILAQLWLECNYPQYTVTMSKWDFSFVIFQGLRFIMFSTTSVIGLQNAIEFNLKHFNRRTIFLISPSRESMNSRREINFYSSDKLLVPEHF